MHGKSLHAKMRSRACSLLKYVAIFEVTIGFNLKDIYNFSSYTNIL